VKHNPIRNVVTFEIGKVMESFHSLFGNIVQWMMNLPYLFGSGKAVRE